MKKIKRWTRKWHAKMPGGIVSNLTFATTPVALTERKRSRSRNVHANKCVIVKSLVRKVTGGLIRRRVYTGQKGKRVRCSQRGRSAPFGQKYAYVK